MYAFLNSMYFCWLFFGFEKLSTKHKHSFGEVPIETLEQRVLGEAEGSHSIVSFAGGRVVHVPP